MDACLRVLTRALEVVLTLLFGIIAVLVVVLVVLRYFFQTTIIGGQEFVVFCFIYTTALGAAATLVRREQIAVTVCQELLPAGVRHALGQVNLVLVAFLNGALVVLSLPWIQAVGQFPSPVLRVPQGWILASLPIGCALVSLCALALVVQEVRRRPSAA